MIRVEPLSSNLLKKNEMHMASPICGESVDYFVITVKKLGKTYTGLLCSISVTDEKAIKGHECISLEKKECIKNCIKTHGIQKSPILITYKDSKVIDKLQCTIIAKKPCYKISFNEETYTLWKVSNDFSRAQLEQELLACDGLYVADGHHRWAAINEGLCNNPEHSKKMLCHLIPISELSIYAYHRILKSKITLPVVLQILNDKFNVIKCESCIKPITNNEFGMFIEGNWYKVSAKFNDEFKNILNPEILNQEIIEKLKCYDPNISLNYFCDICSLHEFETKLLSTKSNIGFTIMPISKENLITVSDSLKNLPQKSTWIEPKLPEGIFSYYL